MTLRLHIFFSLRSSCYSLLRSQPLFQLLYLTFPSISPKGAKFDVSNKQRLGFSEVQLVQKMIDGTFHHLYFLPREISFCMLQPHDITHTQHVHSIYHFLLQLQPFHSNKVFFIISSALPPPSNSPTPCPSNHPTVSHMLPSTFPCPSVILCLSD